MSISLSTLVIKAMCNFMTNNNSNATKVQIFWYICIIKRPLEDAWNCKKSNICLALLNLDLSEFSIFCLQERASDFCLDHRRHWPLPSWGNHTRIPDQFSGGDGWSGTHARTFWAEIHLIFLNKYLHFINKILNALGVYLILWYTN